MSADPPPAAAALEAAGLPYRLFTHSGPLRSLEQAAQERGQMPQQVVRSLLFRLNEGDYVLILVAGPQQVSWKALRRYFGQSRLTLATPQEVLEVTGYPIGAVGPFALAREVPIFIEEAVLEQEEISLGSGRRGTALILSPAVLQQALPQAETISLFPSS